MEILQKNQIKILELKSAVHEMKNSLTAGARKRASELKT
jgi:hypothetical protein